MSQIPTILSYVLTYFTPAVAVFAIAMGLINLFLAGRRSWIMAILRVVFTAGAAVGAIPLARLLAMWVADNSDDAIAQLIEMLGADVVALLEEIPAGAEGVHTLVLLIMAPLLYLLVFAVLRVILALVGWILCKCIPALEEPSVRGVSMPLGALSGLLIVVAVLMPLCGFLAMGGRVMGTAADLMSETESPTVDTLLTQIGIDEEELSEFSARITGHGVIGTMDAVISGPVFDYLTVGTLDTSATHGKVIEMDLEKELTDLLCAAIHVLEVKDALAKEDFTVEDKDALNAAADSVLASEWVTMVATDALVLFSERWINGEAVLGLKCPSVDANIQPLLDKSLQILATETTDTLDEDLHTIADVVGDFLVVDLLSEQIEPSEMIRTISQSGLLTTTLSKLRANPRLAPLAHELKVMSVRLVTDILGADSLKSGEHSELMGNVANELNGVLDKPKEERDEIIGEKLEQVFVDYGYEVPKEVALELSDHLIDELGQDGEITNDELTDYLISHSDELGDLIPDDVEIEDLPLN